MNKNILMPYDFFGYNLSTFIVAIQTIQILNFKPTDLVAGLRFGEK